MNDDGYGWFRWLVTIAIVVGSVIGSLFMTEARDKAKMLEYRILRLESAAIRAESE